jgi:hypothetical protein
MHLGYGSFHGPSFARLGDLINKYIPKINPVQAIDSAGACQVAQIAKMNGFYYKLDFNT